MSGLLRFENGAKGVFSIGQVLPGHKNDLQIEVNGATSLIHWRQEHQNELWLGHQDKPNSIVAKDPAFLLPEALQYTHLPGGHRESWADAFFNLVCDAYDWIREGGASAIKPSMLPTFEDGYRSACLIEAMVRSHAEGGRWQKVRYQAAEEFSWVR